MKNDKPLKVLVINGSPKKSGNTTAIAGWFSEGARSTGALVETIQVAFLKYKIPGCTSCRKCQESPKFECVIDDDANTILNKMVDADIIVMATPLYFFSPTAQLKIIIDRMFSLYKWDPVTDAVTSPLKGKKMILLATSYEALGMDVLEKIFSITANYTGMVFVSLLVPGAGISGDLKKRADIREKAITFGKNAIS